MKKEKGSGATWPKTQQKKIECEGCLGPLLSLLTHCCARFKQRNYKVNHRGADSSAHFACYCRSCLTLNPSCKSYWQLTAVFWEATVSESSPLCALWKRSTVKVKLCMQKKKNKKLPQIHATVLPSWVAFCLFFWFSIQVSTTENFIKVLEGKPCRLIAHITPLKQVSISATVCSIFFFLLLAFYSYITMHEDTLTVNCLPSSFLFSPPMIFILLLRS